MRQAQLGPLKRIHHSYVLWDETVHKNLHSQDIPSVLLSLIHCCRAVYFKIFRSALNQPRGQLLFNSCKHSASLIQLLESGYNDILENPLFSGQNPYWYMQVYFTGLQRNHNLLQQRAWPADHTHFFYQSTDNQTHQKFWKIKTDFTIFVIIGDFYFPLLWPQQCLSNLGNMMSFGFWPMKKVTGARLLHDIWPGEPGHLTEAIIAVDDSTILHSGISYDEFFICSKRKWCIFSTPSTFHKVLIA